MNHPGGARFTSSPADADSLLQTLLWVCSWHGVSKSPASFVAGLPLSDKLTIELGMRAMESAGFSTKLVKRHPRTLPNEILPVVLLNRDGSASALLQIIESKDGIKYEVHDAGLDGTTRQLTESELTSIYGGHLLLMKQQPSTKAHEDEEEGGRKPVGSSWLWKVVWQYRRYYYDSIIAAIIINVLGTFIGLFAIHVYDRVIPNKAYATLWALVAGVCIAILFEAATRQIRDYLMDIASRKADITLSSTLFQQALGIRLENAPPSSGAFSYQVRMFETVRNFGTSACLAVVTDLPFAAVFIFMIFSVGGSLAIVPAVAIIVSIVLAAIVQYPLHVYQQKTYKDAAAMMGVLIESIEGIETLRVTGAAGIMTRRYEEHMAGSAYTSMRFRILSNVCMTFFGWIQQTQNIVLMVWGVYLIHAGEISTGALVGSIMFAGRAMAPVGSFIGLAMQYQTAKTAMSGLNQLMNQPTERDPTRTYLQKPQLEGSIEVSKLSFAYPSQGAITPPIALRNVSLKIEEGERVAFVGKIGSGKSTLLRMIAGLYLPTEGQVKVDGIDIRQIDPIDFRNNLGYVTQDLRLFRGTLRENIFLGRPAATTEAFMEVVAMTGIDKIADAHPMGYDMPIGNMGMGLSGGQRQLVALARALVTRPKILLMDEPTSAMDMQTEAMFTKRLDNIVKGRTVIIVTHRPSLLSVTDRIVVLDQQQLVADGPKEKILAMLAGSSAISKESTILADGSH